VDAADEHGVGKKVLQFIPHAFQH
jgi:hypothetical protein